MENTKQIFDYLPGIWKITRSISSKVSNKNWFAEGYAVFSVSKSNSYIIKYSEKVTMRDLSSDYTNIGTRKYQYKYDENRLLINKYFEDGSLFYRLNISGNLASGEHLCNQDKYVSHYIFNSDSNFKLDYIINGPSKRDTISTNYVKIPTEDIEILGLTSEEVPIFPSSEDMFRYLDSYAKSFKINGYLNFNSNVFCRNV